MADRQTVFYSDTIQQVMIDKQTVFYSDTIQ